MFADWPFNKEKMPFLYFFMKNALKPKENIKKQDYFSQKVTFRA